MKSDFRWGRIYLEGDGVNHPFIHLQKIIAGDARNSVVRQQVLLFYKIDATKIKKTRLVVVIIVLLNQVVQSKQSLHDKLDNAFHLIDGKVLGYAIRVRIRRVDAQVKEMKCKEQAEHATKVAIY